MAKASVTMPAWVVFLLLQTLCDGNDDCIAYPVVFIISIPALAHILPAKCLPYTVYLYMHSVTPSQWF